MWGWFGGVGGGGWRGGVGRGGFCVGWGCRRGVLVSVGGSEGEGSVVVGHAEVGEAREVHGGGAGGEPLGVGGGAAVGDASGFPSGEPGDAAFDHRAVPAVGRLGGALGPAGLVRLAAVLEAVDGDGAPGCAGGAAAAQGAGVAVGAEAGDAAVPAGGAQRHGVFGGAGHGAREVLLSKCPLWGV